MAAPPDRSAIDVTVRDCPDIAVEELRRLLAVELAGRTPLPVATRDASTPTPPERISIDCRLADTAAMADVSLSIASSRTTVSRTISLVDVPAQHRPRLLAIAMVELMSETETAAPPTQNQPDAMVALALLPKRAATASNATGQATARWRFDVAAMTVRASGLDPFLWGGILRAGLNVSGWLAGEIDVESAGNSVAIPRGSAGILLISIGASALARVRREPIEWDSGVGLRGALVLLSGTPATGASTQGISVQGRTIGEPWGGPFLVTRVALQAADHVSLLLGLEGGYSASGVAGQVDGVKEVALTQWWTGLSFGIGYRH